MVEGGFIIQQQPSRTFKGIRELAWNSACLLYFTDIMLMRWQSDTAMHASMSKSDYSWTKRGEGVTLKQQKTHLRPSTVCVLQPLKFG